MEISTKEKVEDLAQGVTGYVDTYLKLTAVKVTDKASEVISVGITTVILALVAYMGLLFGALALGWWIGQQLESVAAGFAIMGGFFVLLTVILAIVFDGIKTGLKNKVIQQLM